MTITVDEVRAYARKMVERESRGNGDQINAIDRVARRCKMLPRALRRIISGETKDPGIIVYARVRSAFLDQLSRQISELQTELLAETAKTEALNTSSLETEIEALADKIEAARKGHNR